MPVSIGRYEILRQIGSGGSADVYEALDTSLNRTVALKVLRVDHADPRMIERLYREAAASAKLRHPHIVAVHDVGEHEGSHYIAMDFIRGGTLAEALPRLALRQRLEILEIVARAVHFAHEHGIIHRDLKPHNVLIEEATSDQPPAHDDFVRRGTAAGAANRPGTLDQGPRTPQVFLSDFGLARDLESRTLTRTGSALGTPYYMAPEQVRGDRKLIRPTTDVWALGVILYELIADRPPFQAATAIEVYESILRRDPKPPRGASPDLATLCLKALEKDSYRRYPSARHFADDLRRVLNGEPILARPASVTYRVWKGVRRHPLPVAAAAVFLTTASIAGAFILSQRARERSAARTEAQATLAALPPDRKDAVASLIRADQLARTAEDTALCYDVNRRLADLALAGGNYDLARLAFAACDEMRPGEDLRASVDERERAEAVRRKARIEAALADLRAGLGRTDRPAGAPLLDDFVFECVQYNDEQTVSLLADALAPLAARAEKDTRWTQEERDLMTFAFRVLGRLDRDTAVAPLTLAMDGLWDHALAVECGIALCNTRRNSADPGLRTLRDRFSVNSATWRQIEPLYGRIPLAESSSEPRTAREFENRASARQDRNDYTGAIHDYTSAIALDPRRVAAYANRGTCRKGVGDVEGALADFTRALELAPDDVLTLCARGGARHETRDLAGARTDVDRALALNPRSALSLNLRGMIRRETGDLEGAIQDFSRSIELSPSDARTHSNRGAAFAEKGALQEALADYERALQLDPRSLTTLINRASIRHQQGDADGALTDFNSAIEVNPRDPRIYYSRGVVRNQRGDVAGAVGDWEYFLELAPGSPQASLVRKAVRDARAKLAERR